MAVESAADRLHFFDTDDFAVTATFTSPALGSVQGIFDDEDVTVEMGGEVGIIADQPTFMCRTADLTGVSEGSAVTIDGDNYLVKDRIDDGTGVTSLQLENA